MLYLILLIVAIVIVAALLLRFPKKTPPTQDVYVCDLCGEKDCICHKEEPH